MVLIFDMDGVIVDNYNWHLKAFAEFGKKYDLDITSEDFRHYFGLSNRSIMNSLFGNKITDEQIIAFGKEKEAIYRKIYKPFIEPVEGLLVFLQYAKQNGIPIALATAAPSENVKFTLETTGLEPYFDVITDSSMVSHAKPDPEVYLVTAARLGVRPSDCIVFEDSIPGIMAAKNAGMRVIGVATSHTSDELLMYVKEIIMNFAGAEKLILQFIKPS